MDKQTRPDLDPYALVEGPVQEPADRKHRGHHDGDLQADGGDVQEDSEHIARWFPWVHLIPARLRKSLFAGSCCAGVFVLYGASMWYHDFIPGATPPFARADSVQSVDAKVNNLSKKVDKIYALSIGQTIRDLMAERCRYAGDPVTLRVLDNQIEPLQLEYIASTSARYPDISCVRL